MFGWVFNRQRLLADTRLLGQWGERCARRFLQRKGLHPLARSFSCKAGEIDLIMAGKNRTIIFVEVKTRANEDFAPAEAAVTSAKQKKLVRAAKYFLAMHKLKDEPCRFDVVVIVLGPTGEPRIKHYESAFAP